MYYAQKLSSRISKESTFLANLWLKLERPPIDYFRWTEYPLALALLDAREGDRVLDIGSADTIFPLALVSKGCHVWATDIRAEVHKMLSGYQHLRGRLRFASLHTEVEDATKLHYPDECFDKVTVVSTIEHIVDDRSAIMESARVLRRGGTCLITCPFSRKYREIHASVKLAARMTGQRQYSRIAITERIIQPSNLQIEEIAYFGERLPFSILWYLLPHRLQGRRSAVPLTASQLFTRVSLKESLMTEGIVLRLKKRRSGNHSRQT